MGGSPASLVRPRGLMAARAPHTEGWATDPAFRANPTAFLIGGRTAKVKIGDAVEAAASPAMQELATAQGLQLLKNVRLMMTDASGNIVGGDAQELDFLFLGPAGSIKYVSAKLDPAEFRMGREKAKVEKFLLAPSSPPADVQAYLLRQRLDPRFVRKIEGFTVTWDGGGPVPLAAFQATYLSRSVVSSIVIESVTPGPDRAVGYQLRASRKQLIDEVIRRVMARI